MPATLKILVFPKSNRTELNGWRGDEVLVRVTAVPENGKANTAVIKLLAKQVGVPKTSILVIRGEGLRHKVVRFETLSQEDLAQRLSGLM